MVAVGLFVTTIVFIRLQRSIFETEFKEEQKFFMTQMITLVLIYVLRFMNMIFIEFVEPEYIEWMKYYPTSFITIQFAFHLFYDLAPVI